jgi:prepilin-type N-terminal cleavage/methylation domain-containing protein
MRRGFTLIELLVVIVIIAILTSIITIAVNKALVASRGSSTETFLRTVEGACASYKARWGDYPPSTVAELGGGASNDVNNGGEALVAGLSSRKKGGILFQPSEEHYVNSDADSVSKNPNDWFFGDNQLREYADFFGNSIGYLHNRDYAKPKASVTKIKVHKEAPEAAMTPVQSPQTKAFSNPDRFQLLSAGPDGKAATQDDIR